MCGVLPAVIVLETLRHWGHANRCERVGYATSAEVSGDLSRVAATRGCSSARPAVADSPESGGAARGRNMRRDSGSDRSPLRPTRGVRATAEAPRLARTCRPPDSPAAGVTARPADLHAFDPRRVTQPELQAAIVLRQVRGHTVDRCMPRPPRPGPTADSPARTGPAAGRNRVVEHPHARSHDLQILVLAYVLTAVVIGGKIDTWRAFTSRPPWLESSHRGTIPIR